LNARLMICLLYNYFFCESAARLIFLAVLAESRPPITVFSICSLIEYKFLFYMHVNSYVKLIVLCLDRGFVFLCNNCKRFFHFDLWFLFPILCTYKCKYQTGKMRHIQHQLLFSKLSFLKSYKNYFSCSSIFLSLTYDILDYVHIFLMSFITLFLTSLKTEIYY